MNSLLIRRACPADIDELVVLVKSVFDRFVAPDYGEEGRDTFLKFIESDAFRQRWENGGVAWVACLNGRVVGMLEIRDSSHICLFFTAADCQRRGIGRRLLAEAVDECQRRQARLEAVTVNASPYSVDIYKRLGFVETSNEQETSGIRFTPMSLGKGRGGQTR